MIVGGIAGFAIDRYDLHKDNSHHDKAYFKNYMTEELNLTAVQQRQLDSIINYAHPKFQAVRRRFNVDMQSQMDSSHKMINSILTPDQQRKFQALLDKQMQNNPVNK